MSTKNTSGVSSQLGKIQDFDDPVFNRFSVIPALTPEQITKALKVRYAVYCQDKGFVKVNAIGVETDRYDDCSTHLLLTMDDEVIGCTRFVHCSSTMRTLPLEGYAKGLDLDVVNAIKESGLNYVEVSRLAILKEYRGNRERGGERIAASTPLIVLALGVRAYSYIRDIPYMFAAVEPGLQKCMDNFVVKTQRIGAAFEHRGTRVPLLLLRDYSSLSPYLQFHYERIHAELRQHLETAGKLGGFETRPYGSGDRGQVSGIS